MTEKEIERLKREAKRIHREEQCSHSHALDRIAARYGFTKWSLLMKKYNSHA